MLFHSNFTLILFWKLSLQATSPTIEVIWSSSSMILASLGIATTLCHFGVRLMPLILGSYLHVRISSARYGRVMMSPIIFGRDLTGNEISTFPVPGYEKVPPQFKVWRTILSLAEVMMSAVVIWSPEKKRFWPFDDFQNYLTPKCVFRIRRLWSLVW